MRLQVPNRTRVGLPLLDICCDHNKMLSHACKSRDHFERVGGARWVLIVKEVALKGDIKAGMASLNATITPRSLPTNSRCVFECTGSTRQNHAFLCSHPVCDGEGLVARSSTSLGQHIMQMYARQALACCLFRSWLFYLSRPVAVSNVFPIPDFWEFRPYSPPQPFDERVFNRCELAGQPHVAATAIDMGFFRRS